MIQYLIAAIVDFLVGGIALSRARSGAANAVAFMAFALAFWSLELFLLTVISDPATLLPWFHATRVGMFFIPPSFALLCWYLIGQRSRFFYTLSSSLAC